LVELTFIKVARYCATFWNILKKNRCPNDRYPQSGLPYFGLIFIGYACGKAVALSSAMRFIQSGRLVFS